MSRIADEEKFFNERVQPFMTECKAAGWAIVLFTPTELGKAKAHRVESAMIGRGWDSIEFQNDRAIPS